MSTINITNARKDLCNLVESVSLYHEPALIVGRKANAALISVSDSPYMQDGTEYQGTIKVIRMWTHYESAENM